MGSLYYFLCFLFVRLSEMFHDKSFQEKTAKCVLLSHEFVRITEAIINLKFSCLGQILQQLCPSPPKRPGCPQCMSISLIGRVGVICCRVRGHQWRPLYLEEYLIAWLLPLQYGSGIVSALAPANTGCLNGGACAHRKHSPCSL